MLNSSPVTAVDRPLGIQGSFSVERPALSLTEQDVHLGLARSTFPRSPASLEPHNFLPRTLYDERWHPGDQLPSRDQQTASRRAQTSWIKATVLTVGLKRHAANLNDKQVTEKLFCNYMIRFPN